MDTNEHDLRIHDLPLTSEHLAHMLAYPDDQAPGSCVTFCTKEAGALLDARGVSMEAVTRAVYAQRELLALEQLVCSDLLCPVMLWDWAGMRVGVVLQFWPEGTPRTMVIVSPDHAVELMLGSDRQRPEGRRRQRGTKKRRWT
jgi:hypothetical protein